MLLLMLLVQHIQRCDAIELRPVCAHFATAVAQACPVCECPCQHLAQHTLTANPVDAPPCPDVTSLSTSDAGPAQSHGTHLDVARQQHVNARHVWRVCRDVHEARHARRLGCCDGCCVGGPIDLQHLRLTAEASYAADSSKGPRQQPVVGPGLQRVAPRPFHVLRPGLLVQGWGACGTAGQPGGVHSKCLRARRGELQAASASPTVVLGGGVGQEVVGVHRCLQALTTAVTAMAGCGPPNRRTPGQDMCSWGCCFCLPLCSGQVGNARGRPTADTVTAPVLGSTRTRASLPDADLMV